MSNVGICIDEMEIKGPPAESQSDFIDIQATEGFFGFMDSNQWRVVCGGKPGTGPQ
ncbi:MAG: hypothetical protein CM1200mP29_05110 [Verrucomicrobiota bacterium]|nr:MAG: hypothetical protein CM1200mP29_05110 [Verrucomicrobiota bacterium]